MMDPGGSDSRSRSLSRSARASYQTIKDASANHVRTGSRELLISHHDSHHPWKCGAEAMLIAVAGLFLADNFNTIEYCYVERNVISVLWARNVFFTRYSRQHDLSERNVVLCLSRLLVREDLYARGR